MHTTVKLLLLTITTLLQAQLFAVSNSEEITSLSEQMISSTIKKEAWLINEFKKLIVNYTPHLTKPFPRIPKDITWNHPGTQIPLMPWAIFQQLEDPNHRFSYLSKTDFANNQHIKAALFKKYEKTYNKIFTYNRYENIVKHIIASFFKTSTYTDYDQWKNLDTIQLRFILKLQETIDAYDKAKKKNDSNYKKITIHKDWWKVFQSLPKKIQSKYIFYIKVKRKYLFF